MSADIDIDPDAVIRVAASMQDTSANSRKQFMLDDAQAAGEAHPRWLASAAGSQCVTAWRDRLHTEADEVEAAAEALKASANNYVTTDGVTAAALSGDAQWLQGA
ncbi:hypothetical protein OG455_09000 [Kitasatospora sp. NBC_01287]|uniref:hypothetical protein n=1 Tax=Kitasatospora sp. NBC_01287 TaxID=2903573 RepID=UPI0022517140|nr:hypothetical protein [Kitasatospora sp. NBC_01287]MCX4745657.1 hypothetical protein [Kitasatospora sp. NBC_01287]